VRSSRLDEVTSSERPPAGGHPAWLVELFQANVSAAFNVAYRLVWNRADAQDVVQTSFIKATRSISQLRDASRARGWLLSITYREALMALRSRRDLPTDPFALPERRSAADPRGPVPAARVGRRDPQCDRPPT
jgi:DNA-directed RNA polymerase specialized sigma24 family protein